MKVCKICNNLVEDDYNFCTECGSNEFRDSIITKGKKEIEQKLNNNISKYQNQEKITPDSITKMQEKSAVNNYEIQNNELTVDNCDENMLRLNNSRKNIIKKIVIPLLLTAVLQIIAWKTSQLCLIFICIPLIILALIGIRQARNTCPECHSWNSLKEVNRTITNRTATTVREKRTAKTYNCNRSSNYTRNMDSYQETEYYVDVPAETIHYDVEFKCEHCGFTTNRKICTTDKI